MIGVTQFNSFFLCNYRRYIFFYFSEKLPNFYVDPAFLAIFKNYSILIFLKNILVVITTRVLNNFSKTTNAIYFDQT